MNASKNGHHVETNTRAATVDASRSSGHDGQSSLGGPLEQVVSRQRSATTNSRTTNHQRFVLADPLAFSYLEEDPSTTVLERSRLLQGYQCYVVEQWACSRTHPTFIIIAYTGDTAHMIRVGVLSVPADEHAWSPRLKVYFKSLLQYHARRKDTSIGALMVTNLSGFPSALNVMAVPDGDVRKHREDFFVNEDLKRLGCTGRVGISLSRPSAAAQAKFYQLYKTSEKIDLYQSVLELVKLCQAALMLFDCLDPEYADGLLCDVTEKAVHDWWDDIGSGLYRTEPVDGILGPTTVAALLGTLTGARNRLHAYGAPVGKDVFDIDATKRAINYFQKSQRIHRSRRLDRNTLNRLHKATVKQANMEGWTVPRAVKSTVAELSGKGGEMVLDIVGRDKASLAEIETTDINRFSQLVRGERAKWLWHGKPHKRNTRDLFAEGPGQLTLQDDTASGSLEELPPLRNSVEIPDKHTVNQATNVPETRDPKKTAFKRATGRIKGAVTKKDQHTRPSRDDTQVQLPNGKSLDTLDSPQSEPNSPASDGKPPENFFDESKRNSKQSGSGSSRRGHALHLIPKPTFARNMTETPVEAHEASPKFPSEVSLDKEQRASQPSLDDAIDLDSRAKNVLDIEQSVADGVDAELDLESRLPPDERPGQGIGPLLRSTQSFSRYETEALETTNDERWPRNLSFSAADDLILPITYPWDDDSASDDAPDEIDKDEANVDDSDQGPNSAPLTTTTTRTSISNPARSLAHERHLATTARRLRTELATLGSQYGTHLLAQTHAVSNLLSTATADAESLQSVHTPRIAEHKALADGSREVVHEERSRLADAVRDLETLGQRVEYEIEGLRARVGEVEGAVDEFERQVVYTEGRVVELVRDGLGRRRGWWGWLFGDGSKRGNSEDMADVGAELQGKNDSQIAINDEDQHGDCAPMAPRNPGPEIADTSHHQEND